MVSKITDSIIPQIKEWQNRPLEAIYPFVFMDAIHYKVREDGQIKNKAAYIVLGVNLDGYKDVFGIWIGENETSKFFYKPKIIYSLFLSKIKGSIRFFITQLKSP